MKIRKQSIFYSATLLIAASIALQLMGFLYRIILSRLVGGEGMGLYQMVMSAYTLLQAVTLSGLSVAVSRLTAESRAQRDPAGMTAVLRLARLVFLLLVAVAAALVVPLSPWVAGHLFDAPQIRPALLCLLPCLLLTGFENLGKASFQGMGRVVPPITSELAEQLIRILAVASLLLAVPWQDPATAAALIIGGMIVSEIFSSSLLTLWLWRVHRGWSGKGHAGRLGGRFAAIALPLMVAGLFSNLMASANNLLLPRALAAHGMAGADAVGTFGIVTGMLQPLVMLPSAFLFPLSVVLVPRLAGDRVTGDRRDLRRKAAKAIHLIGLVGCFSAAMLITLGPDLAHLLFGHALDGASAGLFSTHTFLILSLGGCALFYQVLCGSVLQGIGRQKRAAAAVLVTGAFELVWTVWMVPRLGVEGMLLEFFFSALIGCALNLPAVIGEVKLAVRLRNWFLSPLLAALLCGMFAHLAYPFCLRCGWTAPPALLLCILSAGVVYLAALRFEGMRPLRYLDGLIDRR